MGVYFPKNQVETGFYSNGELVFQNTLVSYTGPYFRTSVGGLYSGTSPNVGNNQILIPAELAIPNPEDPNPQKTWTPTPYTPYPTIDETLRGEMIRYFAKKSNEPIYVEVQNLPPQNQNMWVGITLPWVIKGDLKEVEKLNEKQVDFIIEQQGLYDVARGASGFLSSFKKYIEENGKTIFPRINTNLLFPNTLYEYTDNGSTMPENPPSSGLGITSGYSRFYQTESPENRRETFVSSIANISDIATLNPSITGNITPSTNLPGVGYTGKAPNAQYLIDALDRYNLGSYPPIGRNFEAKHKAGYQYTEVSSGGDIHIDLANIVIALFDYIDQEFIFLYELDYIPEDIMNAWFNIPKKITAGNDKYHVTKSSKSKHVYGRGLDFTLGSIPVLGGPPAMNYMKKNWKKSDQIVWNIVKRLIGGVSLGTPELGFINEYEYPSGNKIFPHFHIELIQFGFPKPRYLDPEYNRARTAYNNEQTYVFTWNGQRYTIYPTKVKLQYLDQTPLTRNF